MSKIAVVSTGGKQYKVKEGLVIKVEKIEAEPGEKVKLDTLLISNSDGSALELGNPLEKKVEFEVLEIKKDAKVKVIKYKSKTRYRRNIGHRQIKTSLKTLKIV